MSGTSTPFRPRPMSEVFRDPRNGGNAGTGSLVTTRGGVPGEDYPLGITSSPTPGQSEATLRVRECPRQAAAEGGRPRVLWVPAGRRPLKELLREDPDLLKVYFRLCDETSRAQWRYCDTDSTFFRGICSDWIRPRTFLFDPQEFASEFKLSERKTSAHLRHLYVRGYVDALHFGIEVGEEESTAAESYGIPVDELIGPEGPQGCVQPLNWSPAAVYMESPSGAKGGFVRMPKEAGGVSGQMLRLLAWLYLNATFRGRQKMYRKSLRVLSPGEVVASYADLGRILEVDRRQVSRWGEYALRDGLITKAPVDGDALWRVHTFRSR